MILTANEAAHTHNLGHSSLVTGHHQLENLWMCHSVILYSFFPSIFIFTVMQLVQNTVNESESWSVNDSTGWSQVFPVSPLQWCLEVNVDFSTDLSFCNKCHFKHIPTYILESKHCNIWFDSGCHECDVNSMTVIHEIQRMNFSESFLKTRS